MKNKICTAIFALLICFCAFSSSVYAQDINVLLTIERTSYKGKNMTGIGGYSISHEPDKVGFYGSLYFPVSKARSGTHYDSLTENSFPDDPIIRRYAREFMLNFGLTFNVAKGILLYSGLGFGTDIKEVLKRDPDRILDSGGTYSVPDITRKDRMSVNVNLGAIVYFQRVGFNLGYHTFTKSVSLGVALGL